MQSGNENWDVMETENGDLEGTLKMVDAYKSLNLAMNNVAIASHGSIDRIWAVQDELVGKP
jgi:hypothetical protein